MPEATRGLLTFLFSHLGPLGPPLSPAGRPGWGGWRTEWPASGSPRALELLPEHDADRPRLRRNDVRLLAHADSALLEARDLRAPVEHVVEQQADVHPVLLDAARQVEQPVRRLHTDRRLVKGLERRRRQRLVHERPLDACIPASEVEGVAR